MDNTLLEKNYLKSSKDVVGHHYSIKVAVWFEDPYKDSQTSERRVHLRILDGRHRYLQDPNWPREYYYCYSLDEYYQNRFHLDIKKNPNPKEWKKAIENYGRYLHEVEKIPLEKLSSTIYKKLKVYKLKVLRAAPKEWRDSTKSHKKSVKTKEKTKNSNQLQQQVVNKVFVTNSTPEQVINALRETIDSQNQEIEALCFKLRTKNEEIETLKKENFNLREHISELNKKYSGNNESQND